MIVSTAKPKPREQSVVNSGVPGDAGRAFITTLADDREVHNAALVTVKEYVPGSRPGTVKVVPAPAVVIPPGLRVSTHEPAGSEFSATLPVETAHVGWVIVPIKGAVGVDG